MSGSRLRRRALSLAAVTASGLLLVSGLSLVGCDWAGRTPDSRPAATRERSTDNGPETSARDAPAVALGELAPELVGRQVAVEGRVTKQCPAAGCWFTIKDGSGELLVDLNSAGLRLAEKRESQHAEVTGRLITRGGQFRLEAESVRFGAEPAATAQSER